MTIVDVKEISIFKDSGERNDVTVKGVLVTQSQDGDSDIRVLATDCHKYANDVAEYNWNWKFRVKVPSMACFIQMKLVDEDMLGDDLIYDPVVLPLEQYLRIQNVKRMESQKFLPKHTKKLLFDSWPKGTKVYHGMFCCKRRSEPTPAVMSIDIEVLPVEPGKDGAEGKVEGPEFEEGRAPELEPKNRFTLMQGLTNPGKFCRVMCGPNRLAECKCMCVTLVVLVFVVLGIVVLFYGVQIEQAIFMMYDRKE